MFSVEAVPDGWYEQLRDECIVQGIEVDVNEYRTPVSVHRCSTCGQRYTICPPAPNEGPDCNSPDCASYDPARDASIYFAPDDPNLIECED
jgi:hypothetical protein